MSNPPKLTLMYKCSFPDYDFEEGMRQILGQLDYEEIDTGFGFGEREIIYRQKSLHGVEE